MRANERIAAAQCRTLDVGHAQQRHRASASWRRLLLRRGRSLHPRRRLTGGQLRDHDDPAIREFDGVVLVTGFADIELSKLCGLVTSGEPKKAEAVVVFDVLLERQFRARKERYGRIRFSDGGKATGARSSRH